MARKPSRKTSSAELPPQVEQGDPHVAKANRYIAQVVSGEIPACLFVRQACERQRDDLERLKADPVFFFDSNLAGRVCRFVECLPHVKGPKASAGEKIRLEDWQCFILTTVFGWRRRDTGGRRFRRVYVEVPRGNGKSALSSAIALYGLTSDGEAGAEVYSAATTKQQAKIVFTVASMMLARATVLAAKLGVILNKLDIQHPKSGSVFMPMSREAKNQDGANLHMGIVDELHAHRTREIYDVCETAMAKRLASMLFVITTAGSDTSGICYEVRSYCVKVLERVVSDETQFGLIYTLDSEDVWSDPASWRKANPNWGVSVMPDEIGALAAKALALPAAASNFQTKHLDVWVNADQAWMDMRAWDRAADPNLDEDDFAGDECFAGLDLASKVDVAAKTKLYLRDQPDPMNPDGPPVRHYYAFLDCYLPESAVLESRNSQYGGWTQEGRIKTSPGDVTDFGMIKADLLADHSRLRLREVAYDDWQATQLAQELTEAGITAVEMPANARTFSAPMKELDALVRSGRFHHDGNPVFRWMVSNVVCHTDAKENIYPRKQRPENKIDGVVSTIMALGRAMVAPTVSSIYESRGVLSL